MPGWTKKPEYEPAPPVHLNPWYDGVEMEQRNLQYAQVYLIEAGDTYKVGFTRQVVTERLREFKTGSAYRPIVVAVRAGGRALEAAIHHRAAKHRMHGEWFKKCPEVSKAFYETPDPDTDTEYMLPFKEEAPLPLFRDDIPA